MKDETIIYLIVFVAGMLLGVALAKHNMRCDCPKSQFANRYYLTLTEAK
jgi:hypothetical protein